jgi:Protein of unknown function (DUF4058)
MPLLDHFRPPLAAERHWESFHGGWAYEMMTALNRGVLPGGYFAEAQVHVGSRVEVDVASFEAAGGTSELESNGGEVAVQTWAPPVPAMVLSATFPDEIKVQVFRSSGGATLVAVVEVLSPANKDRPEPRRAFAAKCCSYLQMGVGLVIIDVITEWQANLHDETITLLDLPEANHFPDAAPVYAIGYRPSRKDAGDQIEVFPFPLSVGRTLPTVPLALRGGPILPLDLEATYTSTRLHSRL